MKWIISRYNHDIAPILPYIEEGIMYDRSDNGTGYLLPEIKVKYVENKGSDIYDKFTYIIDNYANLPDIAVYTKANLFQYTTKEEFDKVKDTKLFTPLLTQTHKVYEPICRYKDGMYEEINNYWYLKPHPARYAKEIIDFFRMNNRDYNVFSPGSNYIIPRANIRKNSKETYIKLRSYLDWDVYPGDCQLMERNLYYLFK